MLVTYLGPLDAVDIPGHIGVRIGDIVDVPADVAGRPPSARYLEAHAELIAAHQAVDHPRKVELEREITGWIELDGTVHDPLDAGEGLLAQFWTWTPAAPPAADVTKPKTPKPANGEESNT
jgi:hypothetical protein